MFSKDFSGKDFNAMPMFETQWAVAAAGTAGDFDGCTISWGSFGNLWGMPGKGCAMATIYVNPLRCTSDYLLKNGVFTISFFDGSHKKDLGILGSKSKRDCDKFAQASLSARQRDTEHGSAIVFDEAVLTLVCRKVYHEQFNAQNMDKAIHKEFYEDFDQPPHYQFIGEIVEVIDKR